MTPPKPRPSHRSTTVVIQGGTLRGGLWCDRCLTPAAFDLDILLLSTEGVSTIRAVHECARCDHEEKP